MNIIRGYAAKIFQDKFVEFSGQDHRFSGQDRRFSGQDHRFSGQDRRIISGALNYSG
ncbi:MAG: hypothetical protein ACOXZI_07355 [Candidatus Cryptobacteroides sp.]